MKKSSQYDVTQGWYRDCGVIPFTQDVDLNMWAHEYESVIADNFRGNPLIRLYSHLGFVNNSFEMRLFNGHVSYDLFLTYKSANSTEQWCGYQFFNHKFV